MSIADQYRALSLTGPQRQAQGIAEFLPKLRHVPGLSQRRKLPDESTRLAGRSEQRMDPNASKMDPNTSKQGFGG